MNYRDFLQKLIYRVINPMIMGMIKIGVTPNIVTFTGFVGNCLAAALFVYAAFTETAAMAWIGWGGLVLILSGLFDMMDGRLARLGNMSSTFGAFWDSTLDRYGELISLSGLAAFWFVVDENLWGVVTLLALSGSIMVSYVRARAEGLGLECKVGFMQRPERVVALSVGAIITGLTGSAIAVCVVVVLIAVLANITAFWRVGYCYKQLKNKE